MGSSRAVYARGGELLRLTLAADEQYRLWVPLERISPTLIDAVLLYEDRRFYAHPGVNPAALVRSAWRIASGERRQGGSTLTMQLARRLYGIDSRTAGGKVAQIAAALWIEARHGKREILEAYLNTAPYGGNIEGVQAASLIYFRKDAARLSLPEALTLAVIPQNPVKRIAERGRNTELQAARERLWRCGPSAIPPRASMRPMRSSCSRRSRAAACPSWRRTSPTCCSRSREAMPASRRRSRSAPPSTCACSPRSSA